MNREITKAKKNFRVLCVWCGTKIRDDKREDASGMCLKCFHKILTSRLQSQKRSTPSEFISER